MACIHDADAVGDLGEQPEIVRHIEHRHAEPGAQVVQESDDLLLRRHIEAGRRLVEHDEIGIAGKRHGDADPLLLAAGELVRIAPQRARRLPAVRRARKARASRSRRAVDAPLRHVQQSVSAIWLADAHAGVERRRRILRHEADAVAAQPVELGAVEAEQVFALEEDAAAVDARVGWR